MGLHVESAAFRSGKLCIVFALRAAAAGCIDASSVVFHRSHCEIQPHKLQIYDIKGTVQCGNIKVPVCLISGALMISNLGIHTVGFVSPWESHSLKN